MTDRRMLAIHDISCVGRCSLTVALPIISSYGIECSVLPSAVLSTHTGGFNGYTYRDLTDDLMAICDHWRTLDLRFDSFYTGFLGSKEQIGIVEKIIDSTSSDGARIYVDPVMGDKGVLYPVFDDDFPHIMRGLCEKADVIMPNLTELSRMLDFEYRDGPYSEEYISSVLDRAACLCAKTIVLTGVSYSNGSVGAVYRDYVTGECGSVMRQEIEGYYHGTGDVFGSALVGAMEKGHKLRDSVRLAVDFTVSAIKRTHDSGADTRYGVDFEPGLPDLIIRSRALIDGVSFEKVADGSGISRVAGAACNIWRECFRDLISSQQIEYMVDRFQSQHAIEGQIADGYTYEILRCCDSDIGFIGYQTQGDRMFLSKLYLRAEYRGLGFAYGAFRHLADISIEKGLRSIYLTV